MEIKNYKIKRLSEETFPLVIAGTPYYNLYGEYVYLKYMQNYQAFALLSEGNFITNPLYIFFISKNSDNFLCYNEKKEKIKANEIIDNFKDLGLTLDEILCPNEKIPEYKLIEKNIL